MIDELVLGLERLEFSRATLPVAGVRVSIWSAHVIHCQMSHNVVHGEKSAIAHVTCLLVDPFASVFLFVRGGTEIAEKSAR